MEKPGCAYFGKILCDFIVLFENHEESWSCSILPAQAVSCRHDNKHMLLGRQMQLGLELIHLLRTGVGGKGKVTRNMLLDKYKLNVPKRKQ